MGGDFAPEAVVKGAVMALDAIGAESRIVLFGDKGRIEECLAAENCPADRFSIVHTTEVIEMGDHPAMAFKSKPDSSIAVGFGYLAKGAIDGFASAGSTGAMMVGSMYVAKPVKGVIRPTISTTIPTVAGTQALIMDVGLNVDCKPEVLSQYGLIGSIYAESVLGIRNPRVALLNIGEEEAKGNAQTQAAYQIMKAEAEKGRYNFVGNVEAREIPHDQADVIVCDGFVGNVILKFMEGVAGTLMGIIKKELLSDTRSKLGALLAKPAFARVKKTMDYSEVGGAPLLGVRGNVVKAHGSSNGHALACAIGQAVQMIRGGVVEKIEALLPQGGEQPAQ